MNHIKVLAAAALFLCSGLANAVQLFLSPASSEIQVGATISVDLRVSDLGNFVSPSLGAFYAEVSYAPSILQLESWSYGNLLGDPSDSNETSLNTDDGTPGFISFDEFSWLSDSALDAMQPAAFTLATLVFRGVGSGSSTLNLGNVELDDAFYSPLTPTAVTGATIQVNNSVPIAPPVWLMLPLGLWLVRRRSV